ncbi:MAG: helicase C-terminal domain-containing protein [Phycisphaeraceae bacterium]
MDPTQLLGPDGPIARRLGDAYEERPQQADMARAVWAALRERRPLLVEAGTGVGKSFAYLLPMVLHALGMSDHQDEGVGSKKRVVISTHTIALQEQLISKDIPLLQSVLPGVADEFSAVLVKGRGNYLSQRRLSRAWGRQAQLFDEDQSIHSLEIIREWSNETGDGTLATLPQLPRPGVWSDVQSDAEDCLGRRCPTYNTCFFQNARRRMAHADVLIVNHALFFADLALREQGIGILPPYDAVVLDEAHTIEDVAAEHFGLGISRGQLILLLNRLFNPSRSRGTLVAQNGLADADLLEAAIRQVEFTRAAGDHYFNAWLDWHRAHDRSNGRIREAGVIEDVLSDPLARLASMIRRVRDAIEDEQDRLELASYAGRAEALARSIGIWNGQELTDAVYWIEVSQSGRSPRIRLSAAPIEVAPNLSRLLFGATDSDGKPLPVVLTSATLADQQGTRSNAETDPFAHIRTRLGCGNIEGVRLDSPFDYTRQAELLIYDRLPEPRDPRYLDAATLAALEQIDATEGGVFMLFTSYRDLREIARRLSTPLHDRSMPMLVQGAGIERNELLARFRHDRRSVLLGTDTFWQGVDVPGDHLRNVIIMRLPFASPERPVVEARLERIEAQGKSAFAHYSLPEAVLKFKQGFGRLIRTRSDSGRVVVLDARLALKPYGRRFLAALPELPIRRLSQPSQLDQASQSLPDSLDAPWYG